MGLQGTLRDRLADFFEIELGRSSKRETDREGEREGKLPCSSAEADTDAVEREEERVVVAKERERETKRLSSLRRGTNSRNEIMEHFIIIKFQGLSLAELGAWSRGRWKFVGHLGYLRSFGDF